MTLLVVGNHQAIDVNKIPWTSLTGVMLVKCVNGGLFDLKHKLQVHTRLYGIPLYIRFVIPPVEDVIPPELLIGNGLVEDSEVMLYGQCVDTLQNGPDKESKVEEDSATLP